MIIAQPTPKEQLEKYFATAAFAVVAVKTVKKVVTDIKNKSGKAK